MDLFDGDLGDTHVHLSLEVSGETGALVLSGQDLGSAPEAVFGEREHEYFVTVKAEHKDALLLALLGERLAGDPRAATKLSELLQAHGVPFELTTF